MSAYDLDLHAWALAQADALRRRSANEIDWENIAEEIESLGKQQYAELRSRLRVLLVHLLKWQFQPERRSRSWSNTIHVQRRDTLTHLRENPSLKSSQEDAFKDAYEGARYEASTEADLPVETFPVEAPYTLATALDEGFWPEPALTDEGSPR